MAAMVMVAEEEANGKVLALDADIKATLGIDFVPNLYRVMAPQVDYPAVNWDKVKTVMMAPRKPDRRTKEIIALAVSAVNSCA